MDGSISAMRTGFNKDGLCLKAYCTQESIRVVAEGSGIEAGGWFTREQALEFISILSFIVNSKPHDAGDEVPTGQAPVLEAATQ